MLISNKKECSNDAYNNIDEPQKQYAQRKKKDTNTTI